MCVSGSSSSSFSSSAGALSTPLATFLVGLSRLQLPQSEGSQHLQSRCQPQSKIQECLVPRPIFSDHVQPLCFFSQAEIHKILKALILNSAGKELEVVYHWQNSRVIKRLGVHCGMQKRTLVHPAMKYLHARVP